MGAVWLILVDKRSALSGIDWIESLSAVVAKSLESCLVGFSLGLVSAMVTIEHVVVMKKTRMPSDDFIPHDFLTVPIEESRVIHGRIYSLLNVPFARLTECHDKPKLKNFVTYPSHSSDLKKIQKHTYLGMFEFQDPID